MLFSLLPFTASTLIAVFWVSRMQTSCLSYIGYSEKLAGFLSVAISYGISVVSFPGMAEGIARGELDNIILAVDRRLRVLFFLSMSVAVFVIVLRLPLLSVVFQRGRFDVSSVEGIALVLPWYVMGVVAVACLNLIRNLYYSLDAFYQFARFGMFMLAFFFILAGLLSKPFSYEGIGMSYAISWFLFLFIAIIKAHGTDRHLWSRDLAYFVMRLTSLSVVGGAIIALVSSALVHLQSTLLQLLISALVSALLFLFNAHLLFSVPLLRTVALRLYRKLVKFD